MFKFINDLEESPLVDVTETKQRALIAEEQVANNVQKVLKDIEKISKAEIFGSSLSAPFRATLFNDWFTLFSSTKRNIQRDIVPIHLFTFGDLETLEQVYIDALYHQQKKSFNIETMEDVLGISKGLLVLVGIDLTALTSY